MNAREMKAARKVAALASDDVITYAPNPGAAVIRTRARRVWYPVTATREGRSWAYYLSPDRSGSYVGSY